MNQLYNYPHWVYWPLAGILMVASIIILAIEGFSIETVLLSAAFLLLGVGFFMCTSIKISWYVPIFIQLGSLLVFFEAIIRIKKLNNNKFWLYVFMCCVIATIIQIMMIIREHQEKGHQA
jgi:hypothetical protein